MLKSQGTREGGNWRRPPFCAGYQHSYPNERRSFGIGCTEKVVHLARVIHAWGSLGLKMGQTKKRPVPPRHVGIALVHRNCCTAEELPNRCNLRILFVRYLIIAHRIVYPAYRPMLVRWLGGLGEGESSSSEEPQKREVILYVPLL